jgi:hypothetical protein
MCWSRLSRGICDLFNQGADCLVVLRSGVEFICRLCATVSTVFHLQDYPQMVYTTQKKKISLHLFTIL